MEELEAHFPETASALVQEAKANQIPGYALGIIDYRKSSYPMYAHVGGVRSLEEPELKVELETIFDLASLTKVLATVAMLSRLEERGWLSLDYTPSYFGLSGPASHIPLSDFLFHQSGIPAWKPYYEAILQRFSPEKLTDVSVEARSRALRKMVLQEPLVEGQRGQSVYSDLGFLVLGYCIEEIFQEPFDVAIQHEILTAMETGLHFRRVDRTPERLRDPRVAATEYSAWRGGLLQGAVHDDNAWAAGGYGGHAGVFGTVGDVLLWVASARDGFFSRKTWDQWFEVRAGRARGWDIASGAQSASGQRGHSLLIGHLGFTGTSIWIDDRRKCAVVLLSNRVHPSRENEGIKPFRYAVHQTFWKEWDQKIGRRYEV